MKKVKVFKAANLSRKRHLSPIEAMEAQRKDIKLYVESYFSEEVECIEEIIGDKHLSECLTYQVDYDILFKNKTTVLVASLGCIGSNPKEIAWVIDELEGDVAVAELPGATAEELKIYAKVEEAKNQFISLRTKAALAEAKAKGAHIGGLREKTRKLNEQRALEAKEMAESLKTYLDMFIQKKFTLKEAAELLNSRGIKTARGKDFKPMTVKRYLDKVKNKDI